MSNETDYAQRSVGRDVGESLRDCRERPTCGLNARGAGRLASGLCCARALLNMQVMRYVFVVLLLGVTLCGFAADPPTPRTRAEVEAVLRQEQAASFALKPLRICLVASKRDHGPGEHD